MKKELKKLINLSYSNTTNYVHKIGMYDIPQLECPRVEIDFLALYKETNLYKVTNKTAVSFFMYDESFDGIHGLWNAIYYGNERLLDKFRHKFKDVKYMIAPDYSHTEDMENFENYYRYAKQRVVSVWLTLELGVIVVPLITYSSTEDFDLMLQGLENVECVCVSTKGIMQKNKERELLKSAIDYTINHLCCLKQIIVYSVSKNESIEELFVYARNKNIEIIIPDNTLRSRNLMREVG